MSDIVERLNNRIHDAPIASERLMDEAAELITILRCSLEQIAIVCTANMDRNCDHRMALDFVRQIANREETL